MTGRQAFSKWTAFWGFVGIGLPISFAGQLHPVSMYLNVYELIPLYATEFLMSGIFGLIAVFLLWITDTAMVRTRLRYERGLVYRIGFAIVIAITLFFGTLVWITSIRHSPPSLRPLLGLLIAVLVGAGGLAAFGFLEAEMDGIARLGRLLTIVGSLSLLSLFAGPATRLTSAAHAHRLIGRDGPSRSNIVLVTIDTLAANHLTTYGYSRKTSPNIDELAKHSLVFRRFYANSNFTTAGIASILTGLAPWSHRVFQQPGKANLQSIMSSLPARLHDAGYLTAYFGSNPWAGGRSQGFSDHFDHRDSDVDWVFGPCFDWVADVVPYICAAASNRLISYSYSALSHAAAAVGLISFDPHSDLSGMIDRIASWLLQAGDQSQPVFLWVHLFPPHDPYAAPKPWLGSFNSSPAASNPVDSRPTMQFEAKYESPARIETLKARYDESIAYVDHYVGKLVADVRKNLGPNTVIVLTADHGESFDHGYGAHGGLMLYDDIVHIPMIISIPKYNGEERQDIASQVDVAPTIAALAGLAPSPAWVGRSLISPPTNIDTSAFAMNFEENDNRQKLATGAVAVVQSQWKYFHFLGQPHYPGLSSMHDMLFDLSSDPSEHSDISELHPDVASNLLAAINEQLVKYGGAVTR